MRTDPRIPRLLAGRDRLSRVEKDAIRERVLRQVESPGRRLRATVLFAAVGATAAAAAIILVLVVGRERGEPEREPAFASRGRSAALADFELSCGASSCRPGDQLRFDLGRASGYRYFAAFALREDGAVVWYFPAAGETSVDLTRSLDRGVLRRAVALDAQHPPGRYRVFGVFSPDPLGRDAIRQRFQPERADLGPGTAVVAREFTVR